LPRATDPNAPPSRELLLLELRAIWELGAFFASYPLLRMAPRGDGHAVLVLPGLAATDTSTRPLRRFLVDQGWDANGWELGPNHGPRPGAEEKMQDRLATLFRDSGRKVSLVGWSLGGVYAFSTAHSAPECVRSVVSLGSPMRVAAGSIAVPLLVRALYRYFAHPMGPVAHAANVRAKVLRSPPPIPSTCIYSATDGVVPAPAAQLEGDPRSHENVWVPGSHVGLGFNAAVMWVLADRLAQSEGRWKPFQPRGWLGSLYERLAGSALKR